MPHKTADHTISNIIVEELAAQDGRGSKPILSLLMCIYIYVYVYIVASELLRVGECWDDKQINYMHQGSARHLGETAREARGGHTPGSDATANPTAGPTTQTQPQGARERVTHTLHMGGPPSQTATRSQASAQSGHAHKDTAYTYPREAGPATGTSDARGLGRGRGTHGMYAMHHHDYYHGRQWLRGVPQGRGVHYTVSMREHTVVEGSRVTRRGRQGRQTHQEGLTIYYYYYYDYYY